MNIKIDHQVKCKIIVSNHGVIFTAKKEVNSILHLSSDNEV